MEMNSREQIKSGEPFGLTTVDLGLSVKWANANLGATAPEDYGDYYAWGETETKENYSWKTYKWCAGTLDSLTKYNPWEPRTVAKEFVSYGTVDNKYTLEETDDAAHVRLGGKWRMPTDAEWTELRTKCTWVWSNQNGVSGFKVIGPNGNHIFLPAAGLRENTQLKCGGSDGIYWSSEINWSPRLNAGSPIIAWCLNCSEWNRGPGHETVHLVRRRYYRRHYGIPVRPVSE